MKKSIFNVALFSMLFVLGACSVAPTVPGGTGDEVVDGGLSDSLDQIGGSDAVDGMDIWSISDDGKVEDMSSKDTGILYLSTTAFKNVSTSIYDGTATDDDGNKITFNDEVVRKAAAEGTLAITTDFKLVDNNGVEIADKKSYISLYTRTSTKEAGWLSKKVGGTEAWENATADDLGTSYNIVSKVGDKLSMIYVQETTTPDTYKVYDFEEDIKRARPYTKK